MKYKDYYIKLFLMHGQGCYKAIEKVFDMPKAYVHYEDIVIYYETSKPYRANVILLNLKKLNNI